MTPTIGAFIHTDKGTTEIHQIRDPLYIQESQCAAKDGTKEPGSLREDILREIKQLPDTVFRIEQHVIMVAKSIQQFESTGALKGSDDSSFQLDTSWDSSRKSYDSLVSSSDASARQLKRRIDDLSKILLPLISTPDTSLEVKKGYILGFIRGFDEVQTRGMDISQEFQSLRERVRVFERDLNKEVENQDGFIEQRIKEIPNDVAKLEAELQASSGFLSACRSVLGPRAIMKSAKVMVSAPVSGTLLLLSGVGAVGYVISQGLSDRTKEIQGKNVAIMNLQLEKISLNTRRNQLQEIKPEVIRLATSFDEIVNGLGVMQRIWKMISSDAVGLQEAMSQLRNARTSVGFDKRTPEVVKLWQTLSCTLDDYAYGPSWDGIVEWALLLVLVFLWESWDTYFRGALIFENWMVRGVMQLVVEGWIRASLREGEILSLPRILSVGT